MGIVRKIGWGLLAVIGLLLASMLVLRVTISPDDYKDMIRQSAAEQGIALTLHGDMQWSWSSRPALELSDFDAVVPIGKAKQPVHVGKLVMVLNIKPLLTGQVVFGDIAIADASTQLNSEDGKPSTLEHINLQIPSPNLQGESFPLTLSMQLVQEDLNANIQLKTTASADAQTGQFKLSTMDLTVLAEGKDVPSGHQTLTAKSAAIQFDKNADTVAVEGFVLQVANLQLTATMSGKQLTQSPVITANPLTLTMGDSHMTGSVQWQASPLPGRITLNLKGDNLDVDQWLTDKPSTASAQPADPASTASASTAHKSSPLEQLTILPGAYRIAFDKLMVNHLSVTNALLAATVDGTTLNLQSVQADAYGGHIANTGSVKFAENIAPHLTLSTNIKGVQLAPLLKDWQQAPTKIAGGTLQLDSRLTTVLVDRATLLGSLSGDVQVAVDDLVLNTVNLERSVCEAAALLAKQSPPNKQWPDQTTLHEVVGAVQIKNGQAYIDPLGAKLDVLTVLGKGPVNLVDNTMDLELDLKLASDNPSVAFCEGMNPALSEIAWPLRCEGNYEMQDGKRLCSIDKSRLEQLALQAARQRLESELLRRLR